MEYTTKEKRLKEVVNILNKSLKVYNKKQFKKLLNNFRNAINGYDILDIDFIKDKV